MIKKNITLFLCLCSSLMGLTQQINSSVISAAGDVNKTSKLSLEWTLGESFVESIFSNQHLYTQGFHQPIKTKTTPLPNVLADQEWNRITILPNPVKTTGKVIIERAGHSQLYLTLSDGNGKTILNRTSNAKYEVIDLNLSGYSSGMYTLFIRTASGSLFKTFPIIKAL